MLTNLCDQFSEFLSKRSCRARLGCTRPNRLVWTGLKGFEDDTVKYYEDSFQFKNF